MDTIIAHVRNKDLPEVRLWLEDKENDVNVGDDHRFSLLHWAAREGCYDIAALLLKYGARSNVTNLGDDTPLHLAASHGREDVLELLLNFYPHSINLGNSHGNTPLHYACFWGYKAIIQLLLKEGGLLGQKNYHGKRPWDLLKPSLKCEFRCENYDTEFMPHSDLAKLTRAKDAALLNPDEKNWDPKQIDIEEKSQLIDHVTKTTLISGHFHNNPIRVKMIKISLTDRQRRDLKEEFSSLRIFNHPNVLPVLALLPNQDLCLITENMVYGELFDLIHGPDGDRVSESQAMSFALDIAKAMQFLHTPELKVNNFRLNSKHVWIGDDVAKIGLEPARKPVTNPLMAVLNMADCKFSFINRSQEFDPAWMSPEALMKTDINLQASDMWSFGVILWELVNRKIPFDGLEPMVIGMQIATENLRLTRSPDDRADRLIRLCLNEEPGQRPRFDTLPPLLHLLTQRAASL